MNYATFVARLEALATAAGAATFWTGAKTANGRNYTQPFPLVELFLLPSALLGETAVQYSVGMGFYGQDTHESSEQDVITIQSDMDEMTQRFIRCLRDDEELELVDRAPTPAVLRTPTVRDGTKIGTGMFIDFTVNVAALPC